MTPVAPRPEFSRIMDCRSLPGGPVRRAIEARAEEREALARRFGLIALDELKAELELSRAPGDQVRLEGNLVADVVQACVVTLEPVRASIRERFVEHFADLPRDAAAPVDLPLEDEDAPEALVDGQLDLGEAVAQHLALALNPYPRAPDVSLDLGLGQGDDGEEASPGGPENPFSALARLKKGDRSS